MLVISQKKGEKIHIGRDITVTVVDIKANKVRLGIEAPHSLSILRDQLYQSDQPQGSGPQAQASGSAAAPQGDAKAKAATAAAKPKARHGHGEAHSAEPSERSDEGAE